MRVPKLFILIALSFSVILAGIGFAAVSGTLDFTGNITFQHKELYISNVSPGQGVVNVLGYSGTTLTVSSATAGSTIVVTVTNPLSDVYYYLNCTSPSDHDITVSGITLGTPLYPNGSVTFTVHLPELDHDTSMKFNFTLIPPYIPPETNPPTEPPETEPGETEPPTDPQEPTVPSGGNANATGVLEFVINDIQRGLNKEDNKHTFEQWVSESNRVRYCRENNVPGGNLNNEFTALNAGDVIFTLEWANATKYNIYLYFQSESEGNIGKYVTVYKQEIIYNTDIGQWAAADSYRGYAKVTSEKNGPGIEVALDQNRDEYVVWYDTLPT